MTADPHAGQPLERAGADLADAAAAMILIHGRGARARGMLDIATQLGHEDVAYLAPQAAQNTWYPQSFLAPIEANQPKLSSALGRVADVLETVTDAGIPLERTILLGFSQGACLSTEYAARNPRRYGGIVAFSGGVIGPEVVRERYEGTVDGTPVFLGCSDRDPHIPLERVQETTAIFEDLDADVTERIYEGMGHTINEDELAFVRELVADVVDSEP